MIDPLMSEPFVKQTPPRCLTRRLPSETDADRPRAAKWPLRVAFESWAKTLLVSRSRGGA